MIENFGRVVDSPVVTSPIGLPLMLTPTIVPATPLKAPPKACSVDWRDKRSLSNTRKPARTE
ncbi:MAG: hypothetical protein R3C60_11640 [Parvularculaceae bacterium]